MKLCIINLVLILFEARNFKAQKIAQKFHFCKIQQSWFILTNKQVNCKRNTKINKESFKFLITEWNLQLPLCAMFTYQKGGTVFNPSNLKELNNTTNIIQKITKMLNTI